MRRAASITPMREPSVSGQMIREHPVPGVCVHNAGSFKPWATRSSWQCRN